MIGAHGSNYYFSGTVDDARIYNQSLLASDIERLYAEILEKHRNGS
jgi:hypothetical protein